MIIAIPVDEKKSETGVCPSFGRSPFFLLYNTETAETDYVDNSAAESRGGAGIKAAQLIADRGVGTLLTPRCGENAEEVLKKAGIPVYKTLPGTAKRNIDDFMADRLEKLNEFHPGFHGHEG